MTQVPPEMPDFQALMQQAQHMQEQLMRTQSQLAQQMVEASAGGGMVSVTLSGNRQVVQIKIDPHVIDPKDPSMLQDLIVAAMNQGLQKVRQLEEESMRQTAADMGVPSHLL